MFTFGLTELFLIFEITKTNRTSFMHFTLWVKNDFCHSVHYFIDFLQFLFTFFHGAIKICSLKVALLDAVNYAFAAQRYEEETEAKQADPGFLVGRGFDYRYVIYQEIPQILFRNHWFKLFFTKVFQPLIFFFCRAMHTSCTHWRCTIALLRTLKATFKIISRLIC